MSGYRITQEYPGAIEDVWQVLTAPEWVARWTTTGQGGRPEDYAAVVGRQFRFEGKPTIGWAGVVYCEVQEVSAPHLLRYSWKGDQDTDAVTDVRYLLESVPGGTRFTWEHTGFTGIGGFAMARLLSGVRTKMLRDGVPPVLEEFRRLQAVESTTGGD